MEGGGGERVGQGEARRVEAGWGYYIQSLRKASVRRY